MGFYIPSNVESDLQQGEFLSGITVFQASLPREVNEPSPFTRIDHDLVIILSQSCDLAVRPGKPNNMNVLLAEVWTEPFAAPFLRQMSQIKQNGHFKYQFLRRFRAEEDGLQIGSDEDLIIDFRRVFSLPFEELMFQLKHTARRRCALAPPYREHLAMRYGAFLARVALPEDHELSKVRALPC